MARLEEDLAHCHQCQWGEVVQLLCSGLWGGQPCKAFLEQGTFFFPVTNYSKKKEKGIFTGDDLALGRK